MELNKSELLIILQSLKMYRYSKGCAMDHVEKCRAQKLPLNSNERLDHETRVTVYTENKFDLKDCDKLLNKIETEVGR